METITENHNWMQCRDQQIMEIPAPIYITAVSSAAQRTLRKKA